jgi:uncharacterized RDD family membrane protein YckC
MPMFGVMNAIAQASAAPVRGPKLDNRRVAAGIVDLAIVAVGAAVILFAGDALSGDASEVRGALAAVILGWALYYYFALESGDGQTVGKKLMKLRVVRADGSPAGMREVAVRTVLRVVDGAGAYIVGLIVMLATGEKRQRVGDLAAGTIVVDASSAPVTPAVAAPAAEAADQDAGVEDPGGDAEAPASTTTITLPSRPAPPATLSDIAAPEAPAAPEMRPFPPVEEPAEEPVTVEPVVEDAAPVVEAEPVVEEPVVDVEDVPVVDAVPLAQEPVADEPAEEPLPEIASPSIQELADDVAAAQAEPAAEVVEAEPVVEAEEPVEDGPVTVKSVETVSAIDLIMGGADEGQDGADEPEEPASA